ncbi:MAG: hypothetical protein WBA93_15755 [Microcoleaceae cyanobacterium]
MGFFSWLGGLLDQLVDWLGRAFMAFLEALVNTIQLLWYSAIATVLLAAYGFAATLYVIFYAGVTLSETLMEIWDPRYEYKPAQVFSVEAAPTNTPLPKNRSQVTKVMALKNVQY